MPGNNSLVAKRLRAMRRRRRIAVVGAVALGGAMLPAIALASLTGTSFEGDDGNLVVDTSGNLDWTNAPNRVGGNDLASGKNDNSFGQGSKEDLTSVSVVAGSIPPNKSDLTRFYVANDKQNNDQFMYLAWERTNTLGSANMDFEINKLAQPDLTTTGAKTLNRSAGDLLVRYDFSGGGTKPTLTLVKWVTSAVGSVSDCFKNQALPCWGAVTSDDMVDGINDNQIDLSQAGFAVGQVNSTSVTDSISSPSVTLPQATFGEAAIDLTKAGVFSSKDCTSFGSAYLKSRSSDAFDAETKDFVAPQSINISNCGSLVVKKITQGSTGTFDYTSSTLTPSSFSLTTTATGAPGVSRTFGDLLAGTYDVAETSKAGWTLTSATCDNGDDPSAVHVTADATVTCTFVNTAQATLRIDKVTDPSGSSDQFTFTPGTGLPSGSFQLADATTPQAYAGIDPGTYSVSETDPGPSWVLTALSCTNTASGTTHAATTSLPNRNVSVTLAPGEDVTCAFTNTKLGSLTITKTDDASPANNLAGVGFTLFTDTDPTDGATAHTASDTATTMTCTTDATGQCSIDTIPLGDYWIVETTSKPGYTAAADQHVTVTAGSTASKTFVDPREFTVITLVCQNSDHSLYPSSVTLDREGSGSDTKATLSAGDLAAFNTSHGTSLTAAQLCDLSGASFSPRHQGSYNGSVTIPK